MLHQILKGAYKTPTGVSEECQNLLSNMLKVNPRDRYTMEQVLQHPWIKIGDQSQYAAMEHPPPSLKSMNESSQLQPIPLSIISQVSEKQSQLSDQGIFSPFEDETKGKNEIPKLPLPKLCLKNGILGQVVTEKVDQQSYPEVNTPNGSLFQSRHRSSAVLNAKHNAVRLLMPSSMSTLQKRGKPKKAIIQTFL